MSTLDVVTITLNPAIDRTVSIPGFRAGETNRVESMQSHAGGKGINAAAVLADLGLRVAVTGFLGRDNPVLFETLFGSKKIEDRFVRLAGNTRQCIKIYSPETSEITEVNFPGLLPRENDLEFLFAMISALDARWYILSGSLPDGVPVSVYAELITKLKQKGKKVLLDTSGQALISAVQATPTIIKPNRDELATLTGKAVHNHDEIVASVQPLLQSGIEQIIVSLGSEGALFINAEQHLLAIPPKVEVRSTVGAGDAMAAGVVAAIERGFPLADEARFASACAVNAIQHLGPGLSSSHEVETLYQEILIQ